MATKTSTTKSRSSSKTTTKKNTIAIDELEITYKCTCCDEKYETLPDNFYQTNLSLYKNGYFPVCRKCLAAFYEELLNLYNGAVEKAIEDICCMCGFYFSENTLNAALKKNWENKFSAYMSSLSLAHYGSKSWLDTVEDKIKRPSSTKLEADEEFDGIIIDNEVINFWGIGFEDSDYRFLQEQYEDWTTRNECVSKAQEEIFKRISFKQLEIYKATLDGKSTKDLDATFQQLLDTANLKPKQTNNDALAQDRTFGQLIRIWEDEKPIPEPDPEYRDVDGIIKYISVYFLGHLAKMVGIKNRYSRMYEEEMKKYTVQKPEYEEDTEALFDAIFGEKSTVLDNGKYDDDDEI